jgi:hypothetical protein
MLSDEVSLTNLDFHAILPKITSKPFQVMKYEELPKKELKYHNIILYRIPGNLGHWTLLCIDDRRKALYFFDPYGRDVDTQWPYLYGYDGTKYYYLTNIILMYVKKGYSFNHNPYNIQGEFIDECNNSYCKKVAEHECGELVCYRIIYKDLNDLEFYKRCLSVGPIKIFKIIKSIEKA